MGIFSKFSIRKLLYNKKIAIAVSAVLAFAIWLSIVVNQTPVIERTITNVPINFDTTGTMAGEYKLEVVNYGGSRVAEVRVKGPAYIVSKLDAQDFDVHLALDTISRPGEYTVQVSATQKKFNSEYSIVNVTPSSLLLEFDRKGEKVVNAADIIPEADVSAAKGYYIYNKAVSGIGNSIIITGPRTQVEKIATVKAVATINSTITLSDGENFNAEMVFFDSAGNKLDPSLFTVDIDKSKIGVNVTVYKMKEITVDVDVINLPTNKKVKFDKKITVMGPSDIIDGIKADSFLANIDYNKVKVENNKFKIELSEFGISSDVLTKDKNNYIEATIY